ncbi:MAG: WxL domain-containing protein [Oscillospiraceae bacterium]|nr:WxL domain-containing protein [Oscillospiraceae bacterium]
MKKILALALALSITCSMTVMAFANTNEPGTGTIEFEDGDTPIIIDPDPEYPWDVALDRDLDFGLQTISGDNQTYSSYEDSRTPEGRLAGVKIENGSVQTDWVLQVEIGHFMIEDGEGGLVETMHGFELELVEHSAFTSRPLDPQVVSDVTLEAEEAPQTIMTITPVSIIAANWEGFLDVLGGTVLHTGEAQAEMTWSIVIPV